MQACWFSIICKLLSYYKWGIWQKRPHHFVCKVLSVHLSLLTGNICSECSLKAATLPGSPPYFIYSFFSGYLKTTFLNIFMWLRALINPQLYYASILRKHCSMHLHIVHHNKTYFVNIELVKHQQLTSSTSVNLYQYNMWLANASRCH